MDLQDIVPESLEDVVDTDDRQTQLQNRSVGVAGTMFHGQGGASDNQESEIDRFLHEVGSSLGDLLGRARSQPMVLAGVTENVASLKASSSYPVIAKDFIPGNPDATSNRELQQAGWDVVRPRFASNDDAAFERFADVSGTGLGEVQTDLIRDAAVAGRVDTLFINPSLSASDGTGDVNTAILHTKLNSGDIVIISDGRVENVAALMRYQIALHTGPLELVVTQRLEGLCVSHTGMCAVLYRGRSDKPGYSSNIRDCTIGFYTACNATTKTYICGDTYDFF